MKSFLLIKALFVFKRTYKLLIIEIITQIKVHQNEIKLVCQESLIKIKQTHSALDCNPQSGNKRETQ